jgi:hypothetical protein
MKLQDDRAFVFFSNQILMFNFFEDCELDYCFLLMRSSNSLANSNTWEAIYQVYHSKLFKIYKIGTANEGQVS